MGRPSSTTVLTAAAAVPGPRSGERRHLTASCAATPGSGDQLMSLEIQHNHGEGPYTRFQPGDGPSRGPALSVILKYSRTFVVSSRCYGATEVVRPVISRNCFMMFCSLPLNGLPAVLPGLGETGVSSEDSNCFCFTLRGPRTKCPDISRYLAVSVRISTGCICNGCNVSYFVPHLFLTHPF